MHHVHDQFKDQKKWFKELQKADKLREKGFLLGKEAKEMKIEHKYIDVIERENYILAKRVMAIAEYEISGPLSQNENVVKANAKF